MTKAQAQNDAFRPVYPAGPSTIPVDSIFRLVNLLKKHGQTAAFRKAAKAAGAFVTADPGTVKFMKDFVAGQPDLRHDPLGARVLRPNHKGTRKQLLAARSNGHQCELS
jgi:hypothetical protein